jgi:hypothetical protein
MEKIVGVKKEHTLMADIVTQTMELPLLSLFWKSCLRERNLMLLES